MDTAGSAAQRLSDQVLTHSSVMIIQIKVDDKMLNMLDVGVCARMETDAVLIKRVQSLRCDCAELDSAQGIVPDTGGIAGVILDRSVVVPVPPDRSRLNFSNRTRKPCVTGASAHPVSLNAEQAAKACAALGGTNRPKTPTERI